MSEFQTGYQALGPYYDDEDTDTPPTENIMVHVAPDVGKGKRGETHSQGLYISQASK